MVWLTESDPLLENSLRAAGVVKVAFKGAPSVKHLVEALGVPHTEVGGVRIDAQSAGLEAHVHGGERVEVVSPRDGDGATAGNGEPRFYRGQPCRPAGGVSAHVGL